MILSITGLCTFGVGVGAGALTSRRIDAAALLSDDVDGTNVGRGALTMASISEELPAASLFPENRFTNPISDVREIDATRNFQPPIFLLSFFGKFNFYSAVFNGCLSVIVLFMFTVIFMTTIDRCTSTLAA